MNDVFNRLLRVAESVECQSTDLFEYYDNAFYDAQSLLSDIVLATTDENAIDLDSVENRIKISTTMSLVNDYYLFVKLLHQSLKFKASEKQHNSDQPNWKDKN